MKNWNNETEARVQIKGLVARYYEQFMKAAKKPLPTPGSWPRVRFVSLTAALSATGD